MSIFNKAIQATWTSIKDGTKVCRELFPTIIPLIILIKILQETDLISFVALPLAPFMDFMGLPVELGLAWAVGMCVGIYSVIPVFAALVTDLAPLTVEQVTNFGLILLIAHGLIVETRIAGQCGLSMPFQFFLRIFTAIFAGITFHFICQTGGFLQEPARMFFQSVPEPSLLEWAVNEAKNLAQIYVMICIVLIMAKMLDYLKISYYIGRAIAPILQLLGITPAATNVVIVGFSMGLIYGSGIIIKNSREGSISRRDIFASMSLLGIAHALIEDTIILMVLGGSLWGLLVYRILIAILVGIVLNIFYKKKGEATA